MLLVLLFPVPYSLLPCRCGSDLRRKAEALVFSLDPQGDILVIVYFYSHDDAGAPAVGTGYMELVDGTFETLISPILQEIVVLIGGGRLPDLVGPLIVLARSEERRV